MLYLRVVPRPGAALRSTLATVEILLAVVAAHTWAGGELPSPLWIGGMAALVYGAGSLVLRGRVRLAVAVPALAALQMLMHCWLIALTPQAPAAHAQMHDHAAYLDLTPAMLAAHAAGAVVTALVWELRRRAVEVVLTWSEIGTPPVPAPRRSIARYAPVLPLRRPLVVVPLRGPPVGLAA